MSRSASVHSRTPVDKRQEPTDHAGESSPNRGAVFTRRWVVDLVLDLTGYTVEKRLAEHRVVEPSCGPGAFLVAIVERLVESCRLHGSDIADTTNSILAVDIDPDAVAASRALALKTLVAAGVKPVIARRLSEAWVRQGDFLLIAHSLPSARWVVGNPPYVRVEDVDPDDMKAYRALWKSMSGRADLYVGFLEGALGLLEDDGRMGVICADRWMRNQYGAGLRSLVEEQFALDACVVLHDVDAFEDRVAAYPAIVVVRAGEQGRAFVCETQESFGAESAARLTVAWADVATTKRTDSDFKASWTNGWFSGSASWPSGDPERLAHLSALEARFGTLEDVGVRVSVGVATGADDIYLTSRPAKVEHSRLLKTLSAREVSTGEVEWAGRFLVNPWTETGLAELADFPGLAGYLRRHKARLMQRYVAERTPDRWWRTVDRVDSQVASTPKLLVPDLKDRIFPVLDRGEYYPSHSLYYLIAPEWDLEVLGGLLLSDIATAFVEAYSVRMASGYLRVSAQYLRRVRLPAPNDLSAKLRRELAAAFNERDVERATACARIAYGVNEWA